MAKKVSLQQSTHATSGLATTKRGLVTSLSVSKREIEKKRGLRQAGDINKLMCTLLINAKQTVVERIM